MQFSNFKDHKISKVGFGCAGLSGSGGGYGFGLISDNEANSLVHSALDRGINLFDNAPIYGFGEAERRLGIALRDRRHEAMIVSKCGVNWHKNGRVDMTNDPEKCLEQLHESLQRLQTDYIDVYMVHWPDNKFSLSQTLEPLLKAKKEGKILHLGLSNFGDFNSDEIDFIQGESNLFNQNISPRSKKFSQAWGTFDKGILTGSVSADRVFETSDCRKKSPWWKKSQWREKVTKASALFKLLAQHSVDPLAFAIRFNTDFRGIDQTLCGFKKAEHLKLLENLWSHEIPDSLYQEGLNIIEGFNE